MNPSHLFSRYFVLGLYLLTATVSAMATSDNTEKKGYTCPPCGCAQDGVVHQQPGPCSACGIAMIPIGIKSLAQVPQYRPTGRPNVAILLFEGVQIIDYTGPYEVLGQAGFNVFTVAKNTAPLTTAMGMQVVPHFAFGEHPQADILLLPGGDVGSAQEDAETQAWVVRTVDAAGHVLTVCNGAFILARTGKLDGLEATTYYGLIDGLRVLAPKCKVVTDKRFVDNGKIVTTAGLSSGIDGALHVIGKIRGEAEAQRVALNMEYQWRPGDGYARADLADRALVGGFLSGRFYPRMDLPDSEWRLVYTWGDAGEWRLRWRVDWQGEAQALHERMRQSLAEVHGWHETTQAAGTGPGSSWQFSGNDRNWRASLSVTPAGENGQLVELSIHTRGAGDGN